MAVGGHAVHEWGTNTRITNYAIRKMSQPMARSVMLLMALSFFTSSLRLGRAIPEVTIRFT